MTGRSLVQTLWHLLARAAPGPDVLPRGGFTLFVTPPPAKNGASD